jgi:hypothetical protein
MARCGCSGQAPSTLVAGLNMDIDGVGLPDDPYILNATSVIETAPGGGGGGNVITGSQDDPTATSVTATLAGPGSSTSTGSSPDGANIAIGRFAEANGPGNIAIGDTAKAENTAPVDAFYHSSVAIGMLASANGDDSCTAVGGHASAGGVRATAVGFEALAVTHGVAVGEDAISHQPYGIVIGCNADAFNDTFTEESGIAIGRESVVQKSDALALGRTAAANGVGAIAVGTAASANYDESVAIGGGAAAAAADDFVLGVAAHKVKIAGRLNVAQRTPSGSADTQGAVGDITSDGGFVYVKTSSGWKRAALATF